MAQMPKPFKLEKFPGNYVITTEEKEMAKTLRENKEEKTLDMYDPWGIIINKAIRSQYKYIFKILIEYYKEQPIVQGLLSWEPTKSAFLNVLQGFDKEYPGIYDYVTQVVMTDTPTTTYP
jgi:hypothetical protein